MKKMFILLLMLSATAQVHALELQNGSYGTIDRRWCGSKILFESVADKIYRTSIINPAYPHLGCNSAGYTQVFQCTPGQNTCHIYYTNGDLYCTLSVPASRSDVYFMQCFGADASGPTRYDLYY